MDVQQLEAALQALTGQFQVLQNQRLADTVTIADLRNHIVALQAAEQADRDAIALLNNAGGVVGGAAPAAAGVVGAPFVVAAGGGRRILPRITFANTDKEDWLSFKESFLNFCRFQRYANDDAKWALKSCMQGSALLSITAFDHEDADENINALLIRYEAKFLPPAASGLARTHYEAAKQGSKESLLSYHGRMATLYARAYPNTALGAPTIRHFINGLRTTRMKEFVARSNPVTWDEVLNAAQSEQAIVESVKPLTADDAMEINAMDRQTVRCHHCDRVGHVRSECALWKKERGTLQGRPSSTPRGVGRTPPPKKGVTSNDGRKNRIRKLLQEMMADEDEDEEGQDEDAFVGPGEDDDDDQASPQGNEGEEDFNDDDLTSDF
jgi:hypothetical protein